MKIYYIGNRYLIVNSDVMISSLSQAVIFLLADKEEVGEAKTLLY